ncbi:MAG: protein O-mannosyl-transferase family [Bradymonadia bacterium]
MPQTDTVNLEDSGPRSSILHKHSGFVAVCLLFTFYWSTASPGIGWFDAAEWALVISQWGLGHPPGSPGYILLTGLVASMSPFDLAATLVFCSSVFGALVALPLDQVMRRLDVDNAFARIGWIVLGGLLPSLWTQAARIELYSLSSLLFVSGACLLLELKAEAHFRSRLGWLGLCVGLTISVNPLFGIALTVLCIVMIFVHGWWSNPDFGVGVLRACAGGVIGLMPYLYCFVVGQSSGRFIWGDWDSFASIMFYFSGQDYLLNWAGEVDRFANLCTLLEHLFLDGTLFVLLIGLGLGLKIKSARCLWVSWVICGLILGFFVVSNRIFFADIPDYHGYLGPLVWAVIIGAAATIKGQLKRDWFAFAALFCLSNASVERPLWHRDLSDQTLPQELSRSILATLPKNAIFVGSTDHIIFPLMHAQAQGYRSDVVVINLGFSNSSWFWRYVRHQHPKLEIPSLSARMDRITRVRTVFGLNHDRTVYVESPRIANQLQMAGCPDHVGIRLSVGCSASDVSESVTRIHRFWSNITPALSLSQRVIAKYAEDLAVAHFQRGYFEAGMKVLRAGISPEKQPKTCEIASPQQPPRPPQLQPVLIGSSLRNLIHYTALCLQLEKRGP